MDLPGFLVVLNDSLTMAEKAETRIRVYINSIVLHSQNKQKKTYSPSLNLKYSVTCC